VWLATAKFRALMNVKRMEIMKVRKSSRLGAGTDEKNRKEEQCHNRGNGEESAHPYCVDIRR